MNESLIASETIGLPLSYQQREAFRADQNAQCGVRLRGPVDETRLRAALQETVTWHEILRTKFAALPGQNVPVQLTGREVAVEWREVELCASSEIEVKRWIDKERAREFDLTAGTMLRVLLLKLSGGQALLVLTLPGASADAVTLQNLVHEVYVTYTGEGSRQDEPIQYSQFSEWQRSAQHEESARDGFAFWASKRKVEAPVLPLQRAVRDGANFEPGFCAVPLAEGWRDAERPEALLLACWSALLFRVSRQRAFRIDVTRDGRNYEVFREVMGPVARTVPVVFRAASDMRFEDMVLAAALGLDEADDWQEFYERGEGEECISSVGFEWNEWLETGPEFHLEFLRTCAERFRLKLVVQVVGESAAAEIQYDPQSLQGTYVERLAGQLGALLGSAMGNPEQKLDELTVLGESERQFVLEECNATEVEYPKSCCLHELFAEQAARTPDCVAVAFEDASLTYRELDRRANQLARRLQASGVGPEVRVGVFLYRSLEMMTGLLGVMKAGGAYLPLDPLYPAERLEFMLLDAQVSVLLTQRSLLALLPSTEGMEVICLDDPFAEIAGGQPTHAVVSGVRSNNLVYTLYTSGSTGKPKGASITHRGLLNYLSWCTREYAVAAGVGTMLHSSLGFDATITDLFPPLLVGRRVEILPESQGVDDLLEAMQRGDGFSLVKITPAHLALLNESLGDSDWTGKAGALVIGGDALVGARLAAWRRLAPKTRLINEYGPTETVVGCCTYELAAEDTTEATVPIGRPIANTRLYVMDEGLGVQPTGMPGELFIGGDGVARGYLGRPGLTAERFVPDPFAVAAGARMYRTGDLTVRRGDGVLEFLGRLDHQVKIRSFRIELGEIEARLEQHPELAQSVVIAADDGDGDKRLVAYVQPVAGKALATKELRAFLLRHLPEYMVPAVFVSVDAFALTAHGKVDRGALPDPAVVQMSANEFYVAPESAAEKTLAAIWQGVLKVERIGVHDDFFRSGGDSIQSILLVARASAAGLRFTTRDVFQHPTIAELAELATPANQTTANAAVVDGDVPLTPIQRWFFEGHSAVPHHFNQSVMLEMEPGVRADLLRKALDQLVAHHDALRLRFTQGDAGWKQAHVAAGAVQLCEFDLSPKPTDEKQASLLTLANEAQAALHLEHGPVFRAMLARMGGGLPDCLLLVAHHLVVDGVSWRILLEDMVAVYGQLERGEEPKLPAKTTSFQQWAKRLVEYAKSEVLARESVYWLGQSREANSLPLDLTANVEANTVAFVERVHVRLDRSETTALLQEVPSAYRTQVDDVLLTALVQAFATWTGEPFLRVDMEGHGREDLFEDVDLSRTVGWFTAVFPVCLRVDSDDPGDALKSVKEQLRAVPQPRLGYGVMRFCAPDAQSRERLQRLPPAQVSFNNLGSTDGIAGGPVLCLSDAPTGSEEAPQSRRRYLLDVIARVAHGCLEVEFVYSCAMHRRSTVETLGQGFLQSLRLLIEHCSSPAAGGFTPSDFASAGLSQEELDGLVAELG